MLNSTHYPQESILVKNQIRAWLLIDESLQNEYQATGKVYFYFPIEQAA